VTGEDVLEILAALDGFGVWIGGGWGIDALAGRQTRPHDDLDLMHREEQEPIDLHPLRFAPDGSAEQSSLTPGEPFHYPAKCFVTGTILGTTVPCLSAEQQIHFHQGYEPRERDLHDLALLASIVIRRS
jgi:lincosamide nucleotidyltransferase A/C/D/E